MADEQTQASTPAPEPSAQQPAEQPTGVRRSSESVVSDAQAFLDAAYAGELSDSGEQQTETDATPATPDPTPAVATAAEAGSAEGAEEAASQPQKPSRKDREASARAKPAEPDPAPAAPPAAKPPEQIIAEYEAGKIASAKAEADRKAEQERFAAWIGNTPVQDTNGGTVTAYERAKRLADQPVPTMPYEATQEQWTAYNERLGEINAAKAEVADYDRFRGFLARVDEPVQQARAQASQEARSEALTWMGTSFERGLAEAGVDLAPVIAAGSAETVPDRKVPAMLKAVAEHVRTATAAPLQARIEDLEGDIATRDSEIDALTRRLGGKAPQAERGGTAAATGRPTIDALDAIHPSALKLEDLDAFMDMLPAGPSRRRAS